MNSNLDMCLSKANKNETGASVAHNVDWMVEEGKKEKKRGARARDSIYHDLLRG